MNKLFSLLLLLTLFCGSALADNAPAARLAEATMTPKGEVALTIETGDDFLDGEDLYVLQIGAKKFIRSNQDGKRICFLIPRKEFLLLQEGALIVLKKSDEQEEDEDLMGDACRRSSAGFRSLGLFSKSILRR